MLHQGGGEPVLGIVALEPFDHGGDHGAVEERIFAEALFGASPARVAAEVGIGRANHQAAAMEALIDVAGFGAFDAAGFADEVRIPGFAHADGLRELGGGDGLGTAPSAGATEGEAVQTFDVASGMDAEPRHAGVGAEAGDLFIEGHERDDVVDALLDGEAGILEGILIGAGGSIGARHQG